MNLSELHHQLCIFAVLQHAIMKYMEKIHKDDKVVLWFVSGNYDNTVFSDHLMWI